MGKDSFLRITVITPERRVLDEPTESAVIPAHDGELGILRNRAALLCELGVGVLRFRSGGQTRRVFIDGGFAQVHENRITLLSDSALGEEEVTSQVLAQAEEAARDARLTPSQRLRARRRAAALRGLSQRG